jgi:hypothetical protein
LLYAPFAYCIISEGGWLKCRKAVAEAVLAWVICSANGNPPRSNVLCDTLSGWISTVVLHVTLSFWI